MASNFTELKAEIASYTLRSESEMPLANFIALAESELQTAVNHYEQETVVAVTSVGNDLSLPTNLIDIRNVSIDGVSLKPVSIYSEVDECVVGYYRVNRTLRLVRSEATNVDVEITYRARFTALSVANPTNWLLTKFPSVYHHAVMAKAYHWLKDQASEQGEQAALSNALGLLNEDNRQYVNSGNQIQLEMTGW